MSDKKRSVSPKKKQVEKVVKEVLATPKTVSYNTVNLVNLISACVKLEGPVTGKKYVWSKAGTIVPVDKRDASIFLEYKQGDRPCCGNTGANMIFAIEQD